MSKGQERYPSPKYKHDASVVELKIVKDRLKVSVYECYGVASDSPGRLQAELEPAGAGLLARFH